MALSPAVLPWLVHFRLFHMSSSTALFSLSHSLQCLVKGPSVYGPQLQVQHLPMYTRILRFPVHKTIAFDPLHDLQENLSQLQMQRLGFDQHSNCSCSSLPKVQCKRKSRGDKKFTKGTTDLYTFSKLQDNLLQNHSAFFRNRICLGCRKSRSEKIQKPVVP